MIDHQPAVPLIPMIDAMSVAKRDIMLMIVIAIAGGGEAGIDFNKGVVGILVNRSNFFISKAETSIFL